MFSLSKEREREREREGGGGEGVKIDNILASWVSSDWGEANCEYRYIQIKMRIFFQRASFHYQAEKSIFYNKNKSRYKTKDKLFGKKKNTSLFTSYKFRDSKFDVHLIRNNKILLRLRWMTPISVFWLAFRFLISNRDLNLLSSVLNV